MSKLGQAFKAMRARNLERLRELKEETHGSAVSFVIGMMIIIVIVVNLIPTVAFEAANAQDNESVAAFSGTVAMIGILVLLFEYPRMTTLLSSPPTFECGPMVVGPYILAPIFTTAPSHSANGPRMCAPSITSASFPMKIGPVVVLNTAPFTFALLSMKSFQLPITVLVEFGRWLLRPLVASGKSSKMACPFLAKISHV